MEERAKVGVVMGSQSDWDVMQHAAKVLKDFGVPFEHKVVSAHRTPDAMFEYAEGARARARGPPRGRARAGAAARRDAPTTPPPAPPGRAPPPPPPPGARGGGGPW